MDSPPPARLGSEAVSERLANPAQRGGGDMAWASIAPAAPLQGLCMRLTPLTLPMERLVVSIEYWIWTRRKFRLGSAFGQMLPPAATDQSLHRIPSKYSLAPSPRGKQGAQQAG